MQLRRQTAFVEGEDGTTIFGGMYVGDSHGQAANENGRRTSQCGGRSDEQSN